MLASCVPGEKIPWSALAPALRPRDLSITRTAEILALAGLLDDDRVPALDTWTESKLAVLAPGIAACARSWTHALRDGTPRTRPRKPGTIRRYLRCIQIHAATEAAATPAARLALALALAAVHAARPETIRTLALGDFDLGNRRITVAGQSRPLNDLNLVRDRDGTVYVLEDNLWVPSGVGYMLENRRVAKRTFGDLFAMQSILPVDYRISCTVCCARWRLPRRARTRLWWC